MLSAIILMTIVELIEMQDPGTKTTHYALNYREQWLPTNKVWTTLLLTSAPGLI